MIMASLIFAGIIWLCIGALLTVMAGLTRDFGKKHFPEVWMLVLGPIGIPVWMIYEHRYEARIAKERATAKRAAKRKAK